MQRRKLVSRILKGIGLVIVVIILWLIYLSIRPVHLEKLTITDLEGNSILPDQLVRGKMTVLNFWATWCKPCIAEMPILDSAYQKLDTSRWQILLISDEPAEKIRAFKERTTYRLPFLKSETPMSAIGISALPKTLVVDDSWNIRYQKTGALTMHADDFVRTLEKIE
jgi:thiol-disulfide isomerase/thioredoxin